MSVQYNKLPLMFRNWCKTGTICMNENEVREF